MAAAASAISAFPPQTVVSGGTSADQQTRLIFHSRRGGF